LGPKALSEPELLALILSTGSSTSPHRTVLNLCTALFEKFGGLDKLVQADAEDLLEFPGLGPAKVARLMAIPEFFRRLTEVSSRERVSINSSKHAYTLVRHFADEEQEVVVAVFLNSQNQLIRIKEVFRGTLNRTLAQPREILREALKVNAASFLIAHNHPSQETEPSEEDILFTAKLEVASETMGIPLVDHLILAREGNYFSFADARLLGGRALKKRAIQLRGSRDPFVQSILERRRESRR
jgi:DNA repair protein RadC